MVRLSRTRLAKRSLIFAVFLIAIAAGAFVAAKNIKLFQVNAITQKDEWVTVSYTKEIHYDNWVTNDFLVTTSSGKFRAFCAEPGKATPSGQYQAVPLLDNDKENQMVKLMIFIYTIKNNTTNALLSDFFGGLTSDEDLLYAYTHATIGYIYSNDTTGLTDATLTTIRNVKDKLSNIIDAGGDAWLMAKDFQLFETSIAPGSGVQAIVWIEGNPQSGSIKVQKCDDESDSCTTPQGAASFSGINFAIYNASGSRVYVPSKNQFYNNNALIASGATNASGNITFSGLPLNVLYRVVETSTNKSYLLTATPQTTTITVDGSTKNLNFSDDVVRGDLKFTKTSDVDGEPMANVIFKIKSTSGAKEEHLVVTDEDGIVDTSASHALHSFHTNGYDDMEEDEIEYLAYGTWFGAANAVDDDRGALPYDTYEITELKCDANKFCYDIGDTKKTVTIKTDGEVVDLGEWSNDCAEFSITTTATDNTDGDKIVAFNEDVEIKDVVDYCLKKDMEFTIKGVVMNKNTKEPVMVDGKRIEQTITLTPESTCGTTEMIYSLNTKDLGGTDLVIFEELYYGDELILSHSDFDNASQTVSVAPPPPDTGAITKTTNGGILSNNAMIIVFAIGGSLGLYASARAFSRKRFLNKKY